MMLCGSLRDRIQPWLRDYVRLQSLAVFLIYAQIGCALIGSLGALYNGVLLINLAIALLALVAIESNSQSLARTYAVLLFCAILLDISWFILFTEEIWSISAEAYGTFFIFSVKLTMAMEMIGFFVRLSSSLLWFQIYRLGASIVDTSLPRETDSDLRNSFLNPPTLALARQCSASIPISSAPVPQTFSVTSTSTVSATGFSVPFGKSLTSANVDLNQAAPSTPSPLPGPTTGFSFKLPGLSPSSPDMVSSSTDQPSLFPPSSTASQVSSNLVSSSSSLTDSNRLFSSTSSSLTPSVTSTAPGPFQSPQVSTPSSAASITEPVSDPKKPEAQSSSILSTESTIDSVANATKTQNEQLPVKSEISKPETTVTPVSSSGFLSGFSSGTQSSLASMAPPSFSWPGSSQPQQLSSTPVAFPASLPTSASPFGEKKDTVDTQEDEMDEEAPEASQTTELSMGSFGGFGLGSTPNPATPKTNPFGGPFGNATTTSNPFNMTVPSGELFRPASFNFQNPQPQPSQPAGFGAFSATPSQTPAQSGFGQPSQIGGGQQALGSVLGSFGQSRQIGAGLPGATFGSPTGFGGSNPGNGLPNAPASGGFAAAGSSATGGFAAMASAGRGFAGASSSPTGGFAALASASGGFASAAPGGGGGGFGGLGSGSGGFGGFAPPSSGGFAGAAGGGGFGGQAQGQAGGGGGGFSAFGGNSGATGKPSELFTQMRK